MKTYPFIGSQRPMNNLFTFCDLWANKSGGDSIMWFIHSHSSVDFEQIAIEIDGENQKKAHFYFVSFLFKWLGDPQRRAEHQINFQASCFACVRVHNPPLTLIHCFKHLKKKKTDLFNGHSMSSAKSFRCFSFLFVFVWNLCGGWCRRRYLSDNGIPVRRYWFQWITCAQCLGSLALTWVRVTIGHISCVGKWKTRKKSHREYNEWKLFRHVVDLILYAHAKWFIRQKTS